MTLSDNLAVKQVIGSLMKDTLLFLEYPNIDFQDFESKVARICLGAIHNLYKLGAAKLSIIEVENEILKIEGEGAATYRQSRGLDFLKVSYEIAEPSNFKLYYNRLKKYSLLRCLQKNHYDISEYYKDEKDTSPGEEVELQKHIDESSVDDILNNIEGKYNEIRKNFLVGRERGSNNVADGIFELIEDLKKYPDHGPMLEGDIFSYVTRGARAGCLFLKSAASSAGKSRTAIFDACRLAYPIRYSFEKGTFIREVDSEWKLIKPRKVLFIVTEMDRQELQTIILAYLSGVNEEHILRNRYEMGEEDRVRFAALIMQQYQEYFIVEEISDPNLINIESTIKKYATIDKIKYCFYDYLHTTASMMDQFQKSGLREDVVLMLMANQLKQLAKDYNIFIFTATQVNSVGLQEDGEFKDASSIRGAKSINDKCDCSYILTKITNKMWNSFVGAFRQGAREGLLNSNYLDSEETRPTHIIDVYKNRRGRLKDVRIWTKLDLGTGERKDLFITNAANYPIKIPDDTLFQTYTQIIENWRDLLQKGT